MNDAVQGVVEDVPQEAWCRTWASGPGRRAPSSPRHHRRRPVFVQFALRWERNWAAQWNWARAVGKRFRGYRAKRLYVDFKKRERERLKHGWGRAESRCACILGFWKEFSKGSRV